MRQKNTFFEDTYNACKNNPKLRNKAIGLGALVAAGVVGLFGWAYCALVEASEV
jgi:hypothetical protein